MIKLLLIFILVTQPGCSFIITAAGSFIGNLGAVYAHEKIQEQKVKEMLEEDSLDYDEKDVKDLKNSI